MQIKTYRVQVTTPLRKNPQYVTITHTLPYLTAEDALRTAVRTVWQQVTRRANSTMHKFGMQRSTGTPGMSGTFTPGTLRRNGNYEWSSCGRPMHATIIDAQVTTTEDKA